MGIVSIDSQAISPHMTGIADNTLNPPAITLFLNKDELERLYGLYQGSGGTPSGIFSSTLSGAYNVPAQLNSQTNKLEDIMNSISSSFCLTKDQLADICKVSRKTLYNWIDGTSEPHKANLDRIFQLHIIDTEWKRAGFPQDKKNLSQLSVNGENLFDLLSATELDKELILFAGSRASLFIREDKISDPFS